MLRNKRVISDISTVQRPHVKSNRPTDYLCLINLPYLAIDRIFQMIDEPQSLITSCKTFYKLSLDPSVRTHWITNHLQLLYSAASSVSYLRSRVFDLFPFSLFRDDEKVAIMVFDYLLYYQHPLSKIWILVSSCWGFENLNIRFLEEFKSLIEIRADVWDVCVEVCIKPSRLKILVLFIKFICM
jgi:hypothetical protein